MAQTGFPLFMDAGSITVLNDSTTTAITAGDGVYSIANNDKFTGTAASVRSGYAAGDIKVKKASLANTSYKTFIGVALTDIGADEYGSVALEGVFVHPAAGAITSGDWIQWNTTTSNQVQAITDLGTTVLLTDGDYIIGKALTGASTENKYVAWKLCL